MSLSSRLGLRTIESQISAILFGSVLITLLAGVGVVLERDVAAAGFSAVERTTAEAQVLSQVAEHAFHTGDGRSFDPILDRLGSREEIAYLRLVGPDGNPVMERILVGGVVPSRPPVGPAAGEVRTTSTSDARKITHFSLPVLPTSGGAPPPGHPRRERRKASEMDPDRVVRSQRLASHR